MTSLEKVGYNIDQQKLVGGKKKNGHKMSCMCPICKNMAAKAHRHGYTDDELKKQEQIKGYKKANGHRLNCMCPICKNMAKQKKSKKIGGNKYEDVDVEDVDVEDGIMEIQESSTSDTMLGGKKSRKSRKSKKSRKSRKRLIG